jgi:hypothetical protein
MSGILMTTFSRTVVTASPVTGTIGDGVSGDFSIGG